MHVHKAYGDRGAIAPLIYMKNSQICEKRLFATSYLSICMEQLCLHWIDFHENRYLNFFFFWNYDEKIPSNFKIRHEWRLLWMMKFLGLRIMVLSLSVLLGQRNIPKKICRENQNTHFVFKNTFFLKSFHLWDNVEKFCRVRQITDNNMAHAHCMLHT